MMFDSRKVDDEMALTTRRTVRFRDERAKPTIPIHQKQQGLAASRRGVSIIKELPKFRKPSEPDFSAEHDE
ncbi:putative cyclic nucleotide-gated ion channel 17 [Panicum miliaceum]|uniref:Cyclic nucleotide-gated ion channel 17 n=1 Tax=Panicum miliaceum TaxID=4540 RepID=A0A3L6PBE3_PANMI|nr:putative cyclic nucleotide-gated ion channel 17 [Panicum miliaceum]